MSVPNIINTLMAEINKKENEINQLKAELKRLEQFKEYDEAADKIKALYDSLVNVGFTEEQAFTLIKELFAAIARQRA